jgi:hypothetical protein
MDSFSWFIVSRLKFFLKQFFLAVFGSPAIHRAQFTAAQPRTKKKKFR